MIGAGWLGSLVSRSGLLLFAILCHVPAEALAHKVNLFATVEEGHIIGKVYFRGGPAAQDVSVVALDPSGRELGKTTTDAEGRFRLAARYRCDTKLIADTGDGHGADYLLAAADFPEGLPAPDGAATQASLPGESKAATKPLETRQAESLDREIAKLREELQAFQQEIRFRDVVGGIGYILGLSGMAFYVLGRRGRKKEAGVRSQELEGE